MAAGLRTQCKNQYCKHRLANTQILKKASCKRECLFLVLKTGLAPWEDCGESVSALRDQSRKGLMASDNKVNWWSNGHGSRQFLSPGSKPFRALKVTTGFVLEDSWQPDMFPVTWTYQQVLLNQLQLLKVFRKPLLSLQGGCIGVHRVYLSWLAEPHLPRTLM